MCHSVSIFTLKEKKHGLWLFSCWRLFPFNQTIKKNKWGTIVFKPYLKVIYISKETNYLLPAYPKMYYRRVMIQQEMHLLQDILWLQKYILNKNCASWHWHQKLGIWRKTVNLLQLSDTMQSFRESMLTSENNKSFRLLVN